MQNILSCIIGFKTVRIWFRTHSKEFDHDFFNNFTQCFEHFNINLTNVLAFCTMSLLYVLLQLILRKLLVAAPPKACHTPRAEMPPSLIQPFAGLLPWLLCIIVVTRRQETGTSRPPEAQN